jgi:PAS domain S-box-containing protein
MLPEDARDRTRRLQALTATLSGALERPQVLSILADAGRGALDAAAGFAWWLRGDMVELTAGEPAGQVGRVEDFRSFPLAARLPIADAIRTARPVIFESAAALAEAYPHVPPGGTPYRAWAVIPLVVGGRGVGAVSFSFEHERAFSDEDRELLTAMAGQASLALERCMLLEAERRARAEAETARQRERELQVIAARLSSALTPRQIAAIVSAEVVSILGAHAGVAALRVGDEVQLLGAAGTQVPEILASASRVPLAADRPMAEAIRISTLVWCASEAELAARYPHLEPVWRGAGLRAWGAAPFTFEGRTVGGIAVSFTEDHPLQDDERELLHGAGQLAAQALERARLYEALRASEEQLRVALTAGRAATWSVDLATMKSTRDPSYCALLGLRDEQVDADFGAIHPDDRPIAQEHFERALRDGAPYEPEVRVRHGDGTYMWVRSHGRVTYSEDGKPVAIAGVIVDIDEAKRASLAAEEERRINETLYRLGTSFASELDHDRLVALITDEIAKLLSAELAEFRAPGPGDDELPRPGLRSYLAVPVAARSGELFGTLRFGHTEAGRFSASHVRLATSIASQAAVALENARLYKTVREQKEQLEAAMARAKLADRRKDEFLAMLGHELRNPLAPISTALELMGLKSGGVLQRERDVIRRQVDHLARLIDDLLDVSRITRGKIQLARQVLELGAVLAKAIEMASPLLEKRMQRLSVDVSREGLTVDADPTRLAQVFQNLLTNAAKYSEPHTQITVRARGEDGRVVVEVSDQGIGIAADILPRLFELFVQGERALDRSEGGLGIGLTIAKSLCELHGGTIEAASAGPGRGSTFTVSLPRAAREAGPPRRRTAELAARVPDGMRVLIVDDNVDAAMMLHDFLVQIGHHAAVAHDGMVALEVAAAFRPEIALLDIGLPVMDGYELARQLRDQAAGRPLRLLALTGYGQESDRARAREAGFDHHLVKPISLEALVPLLTRAG